MPVCSCVCMAHFHIQTANRKCVRNVLGEADGAGRWERRGGTVTLRGRRSWQAVRAVWFSSPPSLQIRYQSGSMVQHQFCPSIRRQRGEAGWDDIFCGLLEDIHFYSCGDSLHFSILLSHKELEVIDINSPQSSKRSS